MNSYLLYTMAFFAGGNLYCAIELMSRARTHYSMFFCSGLAIVILLYVYMNNRDISPLVFALIASIVITSLEFIFGAVFNIWLGMSVWDYSNIPYNLMGQICLLFSAIWYGFGILIYYGFRLLKL